METLAVVPATAAFWPRSSVWGKYIEINVAQDMANVATNNKRITDNFKLKCDTWTTGQLQKRDNLHLPESSLDPKPTPEGPLMVVHTVEAVQQVMVPADAEGVPPTLTITVTVAPAGTGAGVYYWEAPGETLACPDLPAPPPPYHPPIPEPVDVIMADPNDPVPVGSVISGPNGSRWQKNRATTPFGTTAWWARIS